MSKTADLASCAGIFLLFFLASCVPKAGMLHFQEFNRSPAQEAVRIEDNHQMGDRDFVRSTLTQIFDLSEQEAAIQLHPGIMGAKGFGVTCDPYASVRRANVDINNNVQGSFSYDYPELVPEDSCRTGIDSTPTTNTIRNGNNYAVCSALILPDTSAWKSWSDKTLRRVYFLRAMKKIDSSFLLVEQGLKVPDRFKPTAESIKKAYRLFHVIRDPDPKVLDALLKLSEETKEMSADLKQTYWYRSWQYILFTLCIDPELQVISI
jgi:hypothetical protein